MSAPAAAIDSSSQLYRELMSRAGGDGNDQVYACMITSWQMGGGAMPDWLGLSPAAFHRLVDHHFQGACMETLVPKGKTHSRENECEIEDLERLMLMDKAGKSPSEVWMAYVVAAGCMGSDHLWQDLGLWSRSELTALMRRNFPALAARNVNDMKWKRFLYKQMCEAEGIYTCRSPSCEVCADFEYCFGPED